jgi:hypothetical protein
MSGNFEDSNVEAYEIMAEILVTVRKIVHRGLEKAAGKTWYLDGCPPGVYERLVARKENEVAIDRFDREYQELISFASLDDLAEIFEYNEDLARLLERIEPEGATIAERFRQIETLRLKLDAAVPLSEEDLDDLLSYHQEFRDSLAKPKEKPESEEEPETAPADADEAEVIEASEDEEVAESGDFGTQVTEAEELGAEDMITDEPSDAFGTAVVESDVIEAPPEAGDSGELVLEAERAMAIEDDDEVLRVLHREIMSVAEHVLKGDFDQEFPVWQTLKSSGWYDIKQTTRAISLVEDFYSVAEEACTKSREGASKDEIKTFVSESEVGKLLLSLGEMFKRQEL